MDLEAVELAALFRGGTFSDTGDPVEQWNAVVAKLGADLPRHAAALMCLLLGKPHPLLKELPCPHPDPQLLCFQLLKLYQPATKGHAPVRKLALTIAQVVLQDTPQVVPLHRIVCSTAEHDKDASVRRTALLVIQRLVTSQNTKEPECAEWGQRCAQLAMKEESTMVLCQLVRTMTSSAKKVLSEARDVTCMTDEQRTFLSQVSNSINTRVIVVALDQAATRSSRSRRTPLLTAIVDMVTQVPHPIVDVAAALGLASGHTSRENQPLVDVLCGLVCGAEASVDPNVVVRNILLHALVSVVSWQHLPVWTISARATSAAQLFGQCLCLLDERCMDTILDSLQGILLAWCRHGTQPIRFTTEGAVVESSFRGAGWLQDQLGSAHMAVKLTAFLGLADAEARSTSADVRMSALQAAWKRSTTTATHDAAASILVLKFAAQQTRSHPPAQLWADRSVKDTLHDWLSNACATEIKHVVDLVFTLPKAQEFMFHTLSQSQLVAIRAKTAAERLWRTQALVTLLRCTCQCGAKHIEEELKTKMGDSPELRHATQEAKRQLVERGYVSAYIPMLEFAAFQLPSASHVSAQAMLTLGTIAQFSPQLAARLVCRLGAVLCATGLDSTVYQAAACTWATATSRWRKADEAVLSSDFIVPGEEVAGLSAVLALAGRDPASARAEACTEAICSLVVRNKIRSSVRCGLARTHTDFARCRRCPLGQPYISSFYEPQGESHCFLPLLRSSSSSYRRQH